MTGSGPLASDALTALLNVAATVGGKVEVRILPTGTEGRPGASLEARIVAMDADHLVVRVLASASARFPGTHGGDLPAALLSLSYELDRDAYRRSEGLQAPA